MCDCLMWYWKDHVEPIVVVTEGGKFRSLHTSGKDVKGSFEWLGRMYSWALGICRYKVWSWLSEDRRGGNVVSRDYM